MISPFSPVNARGTTKFGDHRNHRLLPRSTHAALDGRQRAVERTEQNRQPAMRSAFIGVRIPTVKGECADARAIRSSHEARRSGCSFGEIGKQRSAGLWAMGYFVHASTGDRCQSVPFFQCARKHWISVAVKIEQAAQGVVACWLQARRCPGQHWRSAACDQRCDRTNRKGIFATDSVGGL